jgi:ferrous-iron efflux pump FieF
MQSASDNANNPANNLKVGQLQRFASYASLGVAMTLVLAKIWAWQQTGSVSILSSLVDSVLDVLASGITVVAIYFSLRPADSEHRFGHGKSEGLAALLQSIIVTASAIYVFKEAIERVIVPQPVSNPASGIAIMALSITLTIGLVLFQGYVVRKTNSMAIAADSLHYRADLLVNVSVAFAVMTAGWNDWPLVDALVGVAVAAYIIKSALEIATSSLDVLLDRELPEDEREKIYAIASAHPEVLGFHDLRTRSGGSMYFIQFHLELDPQTSLVKAHRIMDRVEDDIREAYPQCEIIVHADPFGFDEMRDEFD